MNESIPLDENAAKKMQWYLRNSEGEIIGPLSFDSLVDGILNRKFEFYNMVMPDKSQSWLPISHYHCFEKYLSAARSRNSEGFDRILENTKVSIDIAKLNRLHRKNNLFVYLIITGLILLGFYFTYHYFIN